eukprot:11036687-Ditylum_brightwellii.AAC.1
MEIIVLKFPMDSDNSIWENETVLLEIWDQQMDKEDSTTGEELENVQTPQQTDFSMFPLSTKGVTKFQGEMDYMEQES